MAGLLRYLQQSANRENRSCSARNRLARAEGSEGARMMHQSAPGRSQPDRTKAYRAHIIPTLELHIHAHEKNARRCAEMRPESYADCRNDALKPITADGLRAFTPHFILEPFIFGTVSNQ